MPRFVLLSIAGLLALEQMMAQEDTAHILREVEVVKQAKPSPNRSSSPLQVIDQEQISLLGLQNLSEAVKRFSGVTVQDYGGIGGLKTVSVRSLGSKHTGVTYDGVAVTDAQNGQIDLSRFSLDDVDAVALSIGQSDDIFQPARTYASSGTLSIKTSRPSFVAGKPFNIAAQIKTGSFGLFNPYIRYEQKIADGWTASGVFDYLRADSRYHYKIKNVSTHQEGKRNNSDISATRAEVNLHGSPGHDAKLDIKCYLFDSERGLPGSVILYNDYAKERLWDKDYFVQAYYRQKLNDRFSLQASAKFNYLWTRYVDTNDKYAGGQLEDRHTQREYYISAGALYRPATRFSVALTSDFAINTLNNNLPGCPFPTRHTSQTVLAAKYESDRLSAVASLLGTYITEEVEDGDRPDDRKRLSPGMSVSWRVPGSCNIRLRASLKDSFRVPTFNDMYYMRIGNVNLSPERATQCNVGAIWSGAVSDVLSFASVSLDGYYNKVRDKIVAIPTLYIWKMMNMGKVSICGLDFNVSADITCSPSLKFNILGNYSSQRAVDVTDPAAKTYKHQLPYTPRHTGNISLTMQHKWLNVSYLLTYAGERYSLAQNIPDNRIAPYVEQNISLSREFGFKVFRLRIQGEIINLADINYEIIKYYPMPGRSWRILAAITF